MMTRNRWQAKTALLLACGMVTAIATPIAAQARVFESSSDESSSSVLMAQTLFDSAQVSIPSGTRIQVGYTETGDEGQSIERILLDPDETAEVTLTVDEPIRSNLGTVVVPAGSEIDGELRPLQGDTVGTRFYAETLRLPNGQVTDIDAISAPVTRTETITEDTDPDFIKGAVIGAAAAAVLAEVIGSIDILEVLGGGALGALGIWIFGGGEEETDVVVVEPDTDLDLTLQSELRI
ncbi:MAG: hypothetical protein AAF327_25030 [Cyanobacteria bacterium P01_A01_bin.37]